MFIHDTHLPQILPPEAYRCPEFAKREHRALFDGAWHFAAVTSDLPKDGSYITTTLLERPLILWRQEGEYHAFLNVCPHRYAEISSQSTGCTQRLACQYHGWEFNSSGTTCKIPDAPSFRPLEGDMLALTKFQVQQCGQLLFVNFDPECCSLEEQLQSGFELGQRIFSDDYELMLATDVEFETNWKLPTENTLEGYHLDTVHPKTLGTYVDAEFCDHRFDTNSSVLHERYGGDRCWLARAGDAMYGALGYENGYLYKHVQSFPHIAISEMAVYPIFQMMLPISPTRSTVTTRIFSYRGKRRGPVAWGARKLVRWFGGRLFRQILQEDTDVVHAVQRGVSAPLRPKGGLISAREERVFDFGSPEESVGKTCAYLDGPSDLSPRESEQQSLGLVERICLGPASSSFHPSGPCAALGVSPDG